ncbi:MAG TPA: DPP IV N-terminal domain-containing protein [Tenuifilaceae bacterium]|jgi:dipeptidyl aminopeptidase/acylaminoacyl peptidase|nr:DPP IV N-terminal domain-containing protein [Tenuifilaceae bacterium]HPS04678.1 DPP IV N-terminal domain-containing protein [Tenuifilaceae bacterium]
MRTLSKYKIIPENAMKRNLLTVSLMVLVNTIIFGQNIPIEKANYELPARFSPKKVEKMVFSTTVQPHWLKNSTRFWYSYETPSGKSYIIVDPAKRSKGFLFDNNNMAAQLSLLTKEPFDAQHLPIQKIKFIKNETAIQFEVKSTLVDEDKSDEDEENDMVKKKEGKAKAKPDKKTYYFEYDLATRKLMLLEDYKKPKENPEWANISPNGEMVVFSRHHNLYWMDKENYEKAKKNEDDSTIIEHQLTTDGEKYYSYGYTRENEDNVDEEKNKDKRKPTYITWSFDSKLFAMTRTDMRNVKELWLVKTLSSPRPTLETYKYHMPGEKEAPKDELLIFNLAQDTIIKPDVAAFKDQDLMILNARVKANERDDDYVATRWLSKYNDRLYFVRTSRDLKRVDVCFVDTKTGKVNVVIEERLNTYIDFNGISLINNEKEIIHWSERDGWGHFYLYDNNGKFIRQITSGPFHCENLVGYDETTKTLFFTANGCEPNEDPYYLHLYRVGLDGNGMKLINPGNFDHYISMDDGNRYFVDNYSRVNTNPETRLLDAQGNELLALEKADLSLLFQAGYKFPEIFKVKAADGITDLFGVMYKPFDFDSTKLYPLIEYVYPGPQTESVNKSFSARLDRTDRLAQFGFIVITVGNRGGHPARSKWYHNYGYGNLRNYGLADKKAAAEQLAYRHNYIDINRVGIHGHSGGGFMTAAALLTYPDFFKVGVSNAGNHENNIYNRWWSEKHHGVKEITDTSGKVSFEYSIDKNSEIAKNLKGHLLLTTGETDNNVHPGNTIRLANALIKANKRFDLFMFPGQRHGYGDMTEYYFWLMGDYFSKYLIGDYSTSVDITPMNNEMEKR